MNKRIILIVLDSLGIGASEDAYKFGDAGANTLKHIIECNKELDLPNLSRLGLFNIDTVLDAKKQFSNEEIVGAYGKMREISVGKDTTTGHWEIAGIKTEIPFNTYPNGFPKEFIEKFENAIGRKCIGNISISGTEIIEKLGDEHEKTGSIIVYTSEDSVFQIAVNTEVVSLEELYEICKVARKMLVGNWACARVIARPYKIIDGKRVRTSDRHDFSVSPPKDTVLDIAKENNLEVHSVGKIFDIFNGRGITHHTSTKSNADGINITIDEMKKEFKGIIFTNLVDFDSLYGHRRNCKGYGNALKEFDDRLPDILESLKEDDILIITADHGNDPTYMGFNHTREFVPLLVYGKKIKPNINLGTLNTFSDIAATISDYLNIDYNTEGKSFFKAVAGD